MSVLLNPYRYDSAPAGFSPSDLGSIVYWYDAETSTITYSSGSEVSQINDLSTAGNNATQGTVASQPDDGTTINGQAALNFDGGDYLATGTTTQATGTVALHVRPDDTATAWIWGSDATSGSGASGVVVFKDAVNINLRITDGTNTVTPGLISYSAGSDYVIVVAWDGSTYSFRANSTSADDTSHSVSGALGSDAVSWGTTSSRSDLAFDGASAVIAAYSTKHAAGDLDSLRDYVADRVGVTI